MYGSVGNMESLGKVEATIANENCDDSVTANEQVNSTRSLTENDIPGAALNGKDPATLKIPELKRWLKCRNAPTKGRKAELIAR